MILYNICILYIIFIMCIICIDPLARASQGNCRWVLDGPNETHLDISWYHSLTQRPSKHHELWQPFDWFEKPSRIIQSVNISNLIWSVWLLITLRSTKEWHSFACRISLLEETPAWGQSNTGCTTQTITDAALFRRFWQKAAWFIPPKRLQKQPTGRECLRPLNMQSPNPAHWIHYQNKTHAEIPYLICPTKRW